MADRALLPLDKLDPSDAWKAWEPNAAQPWDLTWAAHLYRRAACSAARSEMHETVKKGFPATRQRMLDGDPQGGERDRFLSENGDKIARRDNASDLRGWWVYAMFWSPHLLREKITLFWHN